MYVSMYRARKYSTYLGLLYLSQVSVQLLLGTMRRRFGLNLVTLEIQERP